jgi:hypothetical protein
VGGGGGNGPDSPRPTSFCNGVVGLQAVAVDLPVTATHLVRLPALDRGKAILHNSRTFQTIGGEAR